MINDHLSFSFYPRFHPSIKTKPPRPDPEPQQSELDPACITLLYTLKAPRKLFILLPFLSV